MTATAAKAILQRAVARTWPVARASELPFPDYWRRQVEWLEFFAPRIGEKVAGDLVEDMIKAARDAEAAGKEPEAWDVPPEIVEAHRKAAQAAPPPEPTADDAWEHAAERAAMVRRRFDGSLRQGRLGDR